MDIHDIEYQQRGHRSFLARVYQPRGVGPFPTVVDVHGGLWARDDRTTDVFLDEALARAGVVVASLDFRSALEGRFPAPVIDVNHGIQWLKAHADEFSGTSLVGGVGCSSGGHLLMLCALQPSVSRYQGVVAKSESHSDASLGYVVTCWAVLDPLVRYRYALEAGLDDIVAATDTFFGSTGAMIEGNPQMILERGEHEALPPILVIHGMNDVNVPTGIPKRFVVTYRRAGGVADLELYENMPHVFIEREPAAPESARALDRIIDFVRRNGSI